MTSTDHAVLTWVCKLNVNQQVHLDRCDGRLHDTSQPHTISAAIPRLGMTGCHDNGNAMLDLVEPASSEGPVVMPACDGMCSRAAPASCAWCNTPKVCHSFSVEQPLKPKGLPLPVAPDVPHQNVSWRLRFNRLL